MSDWICRNYGRKQGLLRSLYHSLMDRTGQYTRLGIVDWGRVERLVFVCQGNICRSAYAEARASHGSRGPLIRARHAGRG